MTSKHRALSLCLCLFAVVFPLSLLAQSAPVPNPSGKTIAERLGYPANSRLLVIHADDFGMMHTVDTAIEEAFENHWITSASLQVPCPWFPEVATWAKLHPDADLGIHLTLNADWTPLRWVPVSPQGKDSSLLDADGYLPLTSEYVAAHAKIPDVQTELHAQIDKALSAGIHISHLDSHMGALYGTAALFDTYVDLGRSYHVPVRMERNPPPEWHEVVPADAIALDKVIEMMPGIPDSRWLAEYKKILSALPPGAYQMVVHLAHNDEEMSGATFDHPNWGAQWRQNDFDTVRSPEFHKFLKEQGFILVSWRDLAKAAPTAK